MTKSEQRLTDDDIDFLLEDYQSYAELNLKIRTKSEGVQPFKFHEEQEILEEAANKMLAEVGMVRLLVLKGRQMGCSTWAGGRYYHKSSNDEGKRVAIVTHCDDATTILFNTVKLFHDGIEDELRAETETSNAKTLVFGDVNSSYTVHTAGAGNVGRGDTIQYLHGSEVAFWPNARAISGGIMEAVPLESGTEIILESTANGMGNMFQRMCTSALKGEGIYRLVFLSWFNHKKYRIPPPEDFTLSDKDREYQAIHGLDDAQMYYRQCKIASLEGGEFQFKQEYPATVTEAFEVSGEGSYIPTQLVSRARNTEPPKHLNAGLLIGVDPAGEGKDTIGITFREGRVVSKCYELEKNLSLENVTMQIVQHVAELIKLDNPDRVFIDSIGVGIGVCDRLQEMGYGRKLSRVNAAERMPADSPYYNRRAYMWGKMLEWFKDEPCTVPDDDILHTELVGFQWAYTSNKQIQLEQKKSTRRAALKLMSPGKADSLALTFAYPMAAVRKPVDRYRREGGYARKQEAKHWMNA